MAKPIITKELLYKHLVHQQMSIETVAKRYGRSKQGIYNLTKKYGINVTEERNKYIEELKIKQVKPVNTLNEIGIPGFYTTKRYNYHND